MEKVNFVDNELVVFKNSQGLKARGTLLKLSQNYIVFEVYNPYSIVQLSEVLNELTITRAEKQIYCGKAIVTNIVNTGIILIVSATLSDVYWKSTVDIDSQEDIQKEIKFLIDSFDLTQKISPEFRLNILSIRSFLSDIKNWLEKLEPSLEKANIEISSDFMLTNFSSLFKKADQLSHEFHDLSLQISKDEIDCYRDFTQGLLHPFFMSSPFPYRVYSKPLGYAGDYEMMRMIQRENAEGPNLFAKFVNVFYTNIPIANSVKNRTNRLVGLIEEGVKLAEQKNEEYNSLSIGCGPALEVKQFIENNFPKTKCNFKLLDFNEETMNFAVNQANNVKKDKSCEISGELNSVHELLKRSINKKEEEERYDLVYCSGLFDYLSDRVCSKLVKLFYSMVKPGGKVFVTNMHSNNYHHHLMEIIFEWYLIYRDERVIADFAPGLGKQKIYTDSTGVNLCLEIIKETSDK
ncbi:MAG: class I SAM-dependent methyltransferase [Rickettsiales bacterium]|nr:class I SAM-dependent methyltransferase [Rickettsiales bacterium]